MRAFKAYDIRGHYPGDWNAGDAYKIGYFLPRLLKTNRLIVGRDIRLSSGEIFDNLCRGINDSGADVIDLGLSTTPMVYWATARYGFQGSVQITASHNPKDHNGLKISGRDALPVGYDNGLKYISDWMQNEKCVPSSRRGSISQLDVKNDYMRFLSERKAGIEGLKLAVDCSNGMAGLLIRDLLGGNPFYLNEEPDGNFPGHDPNPLNPQNLVQLSETVRRNKCDLGIIFDGDADRVMFVDENGNFISPDLMIAVLGHKLLPGTSGARVLQDIRTSRSVAQYLGKMGAEMHTWKVGRAFAAPRLREIEGLYGGELAGHYYFKEFYYSDSGLLAALYILEVLAEFKGKDISVSALIRSISSNANSGEINFTVDDKESAIAKVTEEIKSSEEPLKEFYFDGVRLEFDDWWFNIRPSNTEPYLRLIAEAKDEYLLQSRLQKIESVLKPFIKPR
jgi:phosphomannomutase